MPWWIVLTAGLQDGLNPCVLMTIAVFLLLSMWLTSNGIKAEKVLIFFAGAFIVVNVVLNSTLLTVFLWSKPVVKVLNIVNWIGALLAGAAAVGLFYQWVFLRINKEKGLDLTRFIPKAPHAWIALSIVFLSALAMGVLSTVWPSNYFIVIVSNNMLLPGRFWPSLLMVGFYAVAELWLLFVLWTVIYKIRLSNALRVIIVSGFLFSASGAALYFL